MPKLKLHFQRFEFKYYLPKSKADKLIPALLNYLDWDPYIKELNTDFYQVILCRPYSYYFPDRQA